MDKLLFKRIIIAVLSILIILYIVYLIAGSDINKTVETEEAVETVISDVIHTDCFVIRNEEYIKNDTDGVLSYDVNDGDDVSVGQTIADVFNNENDAVYRQQIKSINEQIKSLKELSENYYKDSVSLETVENQINNNLFAVLSNVNSGDYSDAKKLSNNLLLSICERQMITGEVKDFSSKISQLKSKKKDLESNCSDSIGTISSDKAGYFVSSPDGYEHSIKYDNVKNILLSDLKNLKKSKVPKSVVGKVIINPEWYIACEISADDAVGLSKLMNIGKTISVKMPSLTVESIPAKIYSINQSSKKDSAVLVLECNYMDNYLALARNEKMEITTLSYEGIKVAKRAIHEAVVEKTVKDKNGDKVTKEKKVQGVYVLHGSELQFKEIHIIYSSSDYVLCDPNPDEGVLFSDETIELYDQVIVKGDNLYDGKVIR
ncbi:MAG: hypothetical protein IJT79_01890 [Ruminococcus sp.]|nr:hypothetical protein [Ruminococcus sp.]